MAMALAACGSDAGPDAGSTSRTDTAADETDEGAANIGGTAVDKKPLTHQGFDALDARIVGVKNSGVEGTAFTRVVATPGRLYQVLTVIRGKDKPVTGTHLRIADSLQFS